MKKENILSKEQIIRTRKDTVRYINLQLAALGQPLFYDNEEDELKLCNPNFMDLTQGLIKSFREKSRLLSNHLSPVDSRIQSFVNDYLKDVKLDKQFQLPNNSLVLTQKGHARELSLPPNGKSFKSENITSHRIKQGILNNPYTIKELQKELFILLKVTYLSL